MLLPTTASTVWLLAIVALVCLGSWANTLKLAGNWRFEHFYIDFVLGVLLSAGVAALVWGSGHSQELTFQDNLTLATYRKMAWALGSGVILNLGTMLLLGAVSVSGLSVGFPITLGVALVIGTIWEYTSVAEASLVLTLAGILLLLAAVVGAALSYIWRLQDQRQKTQAAPLRPDPRVKSARRAKGPAAASAIALAVFGGIALSIFPHILAESIGPEGGLAPYSAVLLLSASLLLSVPFFVLFFTTFPLAGQPAGTGGYFGGNKMQHLLGVVGGILWGAGMLASLLVEGAPAAAQPNPSIRYALSHGAVLVAAVWGLLAWREFRGTSDRVRMLVAGMLVLFVSGLGMVAFAFAGAK